MMIIDRYSHCCWRDRHVRRVLAKVMYTPPQPSLPLFLLLNCPSLATIDRCPCTKVLAVRACFASFSPKPFLSLAVAISHFLPPPFCIRIPLSLSCR